MAIYLMLYNKLEWNIYRCPNHPMEKGPPETEEELVYDKCYSWKHAKDVGWRQTSHREYCPPEKESCIICPDCVKELNEEVLT